MMKKLLSLFFAISLTLSACGTVPTQPAPPAQTGTPTVTSTATQAPTSTITPLPTIPTFTPTFDVSTIVTVTPDGNKAECQKNSPYNFSATLAKDINVLYPLKIIDVTNDGFPEVISIGKSASGIHFGEISIFSCQGNSFSLLERVIGLSDIPTLATIQDLNSNGIPEIVTAARACGGFGACWEIYILEWDGDSFVHLESAEMNKNREPSLDNISFKNLDDSKTIEIVIERGLPSHPDILSDGPWRRFTEIFSWDEDSYKLINRKIAPPQFTFQAIQDGDQEMLNHNLDHALKLYEEVIYNRSLEWWSLDRFLYYRGNIWTIDTPEPTPIPDISEYPHLAAYAYYRIMLLHLVQGQEAEAASTYQTLQDTFGIDPYAAPYIEMATAFWEAYQSTQRMYDGCAAAIQYAVEHPEILIPLGSDYHGRQSHKYEPADVCPFR
jgi:hypothetical protein